MNIKLITTFLLGMSLLGCSKHINIEGLTQVIRYEVTDDGFVFYDINGSIPNPKEAYWDSDLNFEKYKGKSLKGLPSAVDGSLWLNSYKGNDWENLPKDYSRISVFGKLYKKDEFDKLLKK